MAGSARDSVRLELGPGSVTGLSVLRISVSVRVRVRIRVSGFRVRASGGSLDTLGFRARGGSLDTLGFRARGGSLDTLGLRGID